MRRRGCGRVLGLALVLGLGMGCKKKDEATTAPAKDEPAVTPAVTPPPTAETLTIRVTAQKDANAGRPLFVVVRAVTRKDFVEDQYQHVAALVVEPDETVLASVLVFPGTAREIAISKPESKTVGVYCLLYQATGTSWKRLFEGAEVIDVVVGKDLLLVEE